MTMDTLGSLSPPSGSSEAAGTIRHPWCPTESYPKVPLSAHEAGHRSRLRLSNRGVAWGFSTDAVWFPWYHMETLLLHRPQSNVRREGLATLFFMGKKGSPYIFALPSPREMKAFPPGRFGCGHRILCWFTLARSTQDKL